MKKIYSVFFILFAFFSLLNSQTKFHIYKDFSLFKYSDSKSILEIYFSVNQRDLSYTKSEGVFIGQANIDIRIKDISTDKYVYDNSVGLQSKISDTNKAVLVNKIIGQQNLTLPIGEYILYLTGYDNIDKSKIDTSSHQLSVVKFDENKTMISDIELATGIAKSNETTGIFYKYGMEITPNPDGLFGMNLNKLLYYFEIYSIVKDFPGDSVFLETSIIDVNSNSTLVQNLKYVKSKHAAFVETGSLGIDSLEKGKYLLKIKLLDNTTGKSIEKERFFHVYNKSKNISSDNIEEEKDYLNSEYKTMNLEKLEDEYNKSLYIRSANETDVYKKLKDIDEKRKFMFNFWKKRKFEPNGYVDNSKLAYFKRINEANYYYKQGFMEGWKSDKGRIYITYGKPSEIDLHPNEADSKAYEIWSYSNVQGGAICVFGEYDLGTGVFYLVHSTIRGEFKDDDWKSKITK
jgi:GWxTD domain-containing protein